MSKNGTDKLVQIKSAKNGASPADQAEASPAAPEKLDLAAVREKLGSARGPKYWRSLEELSNQDGFNELLESEFPRQAGEWLDPVSRRGFLKLMSASLALAGLSACTRQPEEEIVPYVQQPEELVLGKSMYYATAHPLNNGAEPLLVRSYTYRPIKIEGNPQHEYSKGATSAYSMASILDLYDPDRSQTITNKGETSTWGADARIFGNRGSNTGGRS
jgi:molybdopterin-containing oxidoreductase family iron-sulfur binding subunit